MTNAYTDCGEISLEKHPPERLRRSGKGYAKVGVREKGCEDQRRDLALHHVHWWVLILTMLKIQVLLVQC
jgi:hypothetical protein